MFHTNNFFLFLFFCFSYIDDLCRKVTAKLDFKKMTSKFMDFFECTHCKHSIMQKSKAFWASKYVRSVILQKVSKNQFNNDLLQQLQNYHMNQGKVGGRKFVDRPKIHGYNFCWSRCFPFFHACEYSKMLRMRKQAELGVDKWVHQGIGKHYRHTKGSHVHQWLKAYQHVFGETQPTSKKKIELPPDTKANIFIAYMVEMEDKGYPKVSYHHFLKIWNEDFPNLILPKKCRLVCFFFSSLSFCSFLGQVYSLCSMQRCSPEQTIYQRKKTARKKGLWGSSYSSYERKVGVA